jgi:hypothetical protein
VTAVLAAAVAVSWIALILLGLGYAQLVAQIKELQSRGATERPSVFADLAAPSAGKRTVALAVTTTCDTCTVVFEEWLTVAPRLAAAGHRAVLISVDNTDIWSSRGAQNVVLAADLSAPLLLAYQPALVQFDDTGALLSADPLGSTAGLHDACASLFDLAAAH